MMTERDALRAGAGETPSEWISHIHDRLASSRAELVALQLDDVTGELEQQNLPGTVEGHPNWRRRAGVTVEQIGATPEIARAAKLMRDAGRTTEGGGVPS